jgi:hypothetical protein
MNEDARTTSQAHEALARPSRRAERRIRLGRALEALTSAACVGLLAAAVALVLSKTGHLHARGVGVAFGCSGIGVALVALLSYMRPLASRAGAVALDRYHGLSDRISSALSFLEIPPEGRTPMMELAIFDGALAAKSADPRRAVPLRAPRRLYPALGLLGATIGVALFHLKTAAPPPVVAKTIDAVDVTADDLDAMREFLHAETEKNQSDETKAVLTEFNQLIEDLAQKRLDRTEAFRRMQALEDRLLEGRAADRKALEEALQKIGEELKKADLTRPAGEALDAKNLANAADAMSKLADKLRAKGGGLDKAELQKMRDALKRASEDNASRERAIAERREEVQKDLLRDKQQRTEKDGGANEEERSLLRKKERELERLDREDQEKQAAGRQLDRLDRELAQAAEDLMKDLGQSAQDLDQGAQDINHMAKDQMTDEEKEQLKEKLEELREMLRQQGQGGKQQMVRLRRFQQHARGQNGGGQGQSGQGDESEGQEGQEGQGQSGQNGQNGQGQNGQGQQGQGQGQGQGQLGRGSAGAGQRGGGQGQGQGGGEVWVLGPNGEKILMLSQGPSQSGSGQGSGQNGGSGGGDGHGSHNWGTGHDEHVQASATRSTGGTEDTQVEGQDTGQGATRSEVIQGAAERGFASRGYTRVYREYHAVAEEALGKDDIPGGYRFYVKRYFQLIRPRE